MKFYKFFPILTSFVYVLLGILTIASVIHGTIGLYINVVMGSFFIAIGCYLYSKFRSAVKVISLVSKKDFQEKKALNRFMFLELIFYLFSFLLGIVLISGAASRIFIEQLPIFG